MRDLKTISEELKQLDAAVRARHISPAVYKVARKALLEELESASATKRAADDLELGDPVGRRSRPAGRSRARQDDFDLGDPVGRPSRPAGHGNRARQDDFDLGDPVGADDVVLEPVTRKTTAPARKRVERRRDPVAVERDRNRGASAGRKVVKTEPAIEAAATPTSGPAPVETLDHDLGPSRGDPAADADDLIRTYRMGVFNVELGLSESSTPYRISLLVIVLIAVASGAVWKLEAEGLWSHVGLVLWSFMIVLPCWMVSDAQNVVKRLTPRHPIAWLPPYLWGVGTSLLCCVMAPVYMALRTHQVLWLQAHSPERSGGAWGSYAVGWATFVGSGGILLVLSGDVLDEEVNAFPDVVADIEPPEPMLAASLAQTCRQYKECFSDPSKGDLRTRYYKCESQLTTNPDAHARLIRLNKCLTERCTDVLLSLRLDDDVDAIWRQCQCKRCSAEATACGYSCQAEAPLTTDVIPDELHAEMLGRSKEEWVALLGPPTKTQQLPPRSAQDDRIVRCQLGAAYRWGDGVVYSKYGIHEPIAAREALTVFFRPDGRAVQSDYLFAGDVLKTIPSGFMFSRPVSALALESRLLEAPASLSAMAYDAGGWEIHTTGAPYGPAPMGINAWWEVEGYLVMVNLGPGWIDDFNTHTDRKFSRWAERLSEWQWNSTTVVRMDLCDIDPTPYPTVRLQDLAALDPLSPDEIKKLSAEPRAPPAQQKRSLHAPKPTAAGRASTSRSAPGFIPSTYTALREAGCDPVKAHVWTPIEARVLRNAPFAMAGRKFQAPELSTLYQSDGDWYDGREDDVEISEADKACVAKLKDRETILRKTMKPGTEIENWVTYDPRAFRGLRQATAQFPDGLVPDQTTVLDDGTLYWALYDAQCVGHEECGGVVFRCRDGVCSVGAAG